MIGGSSGASSPPLLPVNAAGYRSNCWRSDRNESGPARNKPHADLPDGSGDRGLFAPRRKSLHLLGSESRRRLLGLPGGLVVRVVRVRSRSRDILHIVSYGSALCSVAASPARSTCGAGSVNQ